MTDQATKIAVPIAKISKKQQVRIADIRDAHGDHSSDKKHTVGVPHFRRRDLVDAKDEKYALATMYLKKAARMKLYGQDDDSYDRKLMSRVKGVRGAVDQVTRFRSLWGGHVKDMNSTYVLHNRLAEMQRIEPGFIDECEKEGWNVKRANAVAVERMPHVQAKGAKYSQSRRRRDREKRQQQQQKPS